MTNFNLPIDLSLKIINTTYKGRQLILEDIFLYEGPITMQHLPYGGIQSVFNNLIIIHCVNGFIASSVVNYNGNKMSSATFIRIFPNLVNEVLPN